MSDSSGYTVRQLLPSKFQQIDEAMKHAMRDDPAFQSKQPPGVALSVAGDRVTEAVCGALDCDVFELIAQAWAKALEIKKAASDAEKVEDKTATVFLGKHELTADLDPIVELTFGAMGKLTLRFTLEFAAKLDLAQVTITGRRIVKIGKTEGRASAVLKYGKIELHHPLESKKIPLLEDLVLKHPIPIGI
jgi:hypothetical protein